MESQIRGSPQDTIRSLLCEKKNSVRCVLVLYWKYIVSWGQFDLKNKYWGWKLFSHAIERTWNIFYWTSKLGRCSTIFCHYFAFHYCPCNETSYFRNLLFSLFLPSDDIWKSLIKTSPSSTEAVTSPPHLLRSASIPSRLHASSAHHRLYFMKDSLDFRGAVEVMKA